MNLLITGANGFIGKNLVVRLREPGGYNLAFLHRGDDIDEVFARLEGKLDAVVHLAGVNRPVDDGEYQPGNAGLTAILCQRLEKLGYPVHVIFTSSTQVLKDNPYGRSKSEAETLLAGYSTRTGSPVSVFRLPNVFGKWCRPDYNSVVATFCYNIVNGLDIQIHDPATTLRLVYIDDVIASFLATLDSPPRGVCFPEVSVIYEITLKALSDLLYRFHASRDTLMVENVGSGLKRALYATYLSYLGPENFRYALKANNDNRGSFVEFLKTPDAGQFSFLTAGPGITRGCHYHHTKNEKFLVVQGEAQFRFRHLVTGETHEISTSAAVPEVVETIPGWVHDITNSGDRELIVLLWANEVFDRDRPDTVGAPIDG